MLPFTTSVIIDSDLSVAECLRRLDESVISERIINPFAIFTSRSLYPVAGKIKGNKAILRWRTFYSNSFQRLLRLSVEPGPMGCRLSGEFAMFWFIYLFVALWFGFLIIFSTVWTIDLIRGQVTHVGKASDWLEFTPYAMMIFGYVLLKFCLWLSSKTEPKLLQFVLKTVDGRAVENSQ
jgi:hypothetical protein